MRYLLISILFWLLCHSVYGTGICENSFRLDKGQKKGQFAFTKTGTITYKESTIKILKGDLLLGIASISVSVSGSGRYAFITLIDGDVGVMQWLVYNTITRKIIFADEGAAQIDAIWSENSSYQEEEYLVIPAGGEIMESFTYVNLLTKVRKDIHIDFSDLSECQWSVLSNCHNWLNDQVVSVIIEILPNPWAEEDCDEEAFYPPRLAVLDLKNGSYTMIK